ncbi:Formiminoglutamase, partial [hydrothermal vent metagenome]
GPAAFRRALAHYGSATPEGLAWPIVYDAGNVPSAGNNAKTLAETHDHVTEAVGAILDAGLLPVGIGGGHDLSFPFIRALAGRSEQEAGLEVVAFDPHLDVREEIGSGMPFRALVEQCGVNALHNFGANPLANAGEHAAWFAAHGGTIHPSESSEAFFDTAACDLAVSFDLDLLDAAYAPGVSAMNPCGWTPAQATAAVFAAGRCPRVRCFDLMELSPPNDHADRTSRLAAHLFLTFLRGYAQRNTTTTS